MLLTYAAASLSRSRFEVHCASVTSQVLTTSLWSVSHLSAVCRRGEVDSSSSSFILTTRPNYEDSGKRIRRSVNRNFIPFILSQLGCEM